MLDTLFTINILADIGSDITFLEKKFAKLLYLRKYPIEKTITVQGISGQVEVNQYCRLLLNNIEIKAYLIDNICPEINVNRPPQAFLRYVEQENIKLTQNYFDKTSIKIDLLIGIDQIRKIFVAGQQKICNNIVLSPTKFGYLIYGGLQTDSFPKFKILRQCLYITNNMLDKTLRKFWSLEHASEFLSENKRTEAERFSEKNFENNTQLVRFDPARGVSLSLKNFC